jgi:hypothetical protein
MNDTMSAFISPRTCQVRGLMKADIVSFIALDHLHRTVRELMYVGNSYMPQHHGIDELLTYFEHTYIRGRRLTGRGRNYRPAFLPPASWNKRDSAMEEIACTTNMCEGWHNSLQSLLLCSHPSM